MVQKADIDVDAALEQWARWVRDGLAGVGWPRETLLARVIEYGALGAAQRYYGALLLMGKAAEYDEMVAWTEAAITRLALEERNVIVRVYLHWEPPEVSAKALGISRGTFDSRLSRAKRSVRDYLEGRRAAALALQEKVA
jgi:DNA-directed RNA polymerase specialized sigma24 family protein